MPLLPVETGQIVKVSAFFEASKLLGAGRYAEVYQAYANNYGCDVALKVYKQFDEQTHLEAKAEAEVLRSVGALNSAYFPKLLHATKHRARNQQHPVLVLELGSYVASDGHAITAKLSDVLKDPSEGRPLEIEADFYEAPSLTKWLVHLFQAVALLHKAGVVHRDVKPMNIVLKRTRLGSPTIPFLLDFNSCAASATTARGTPRYLPPEVRAGGRANPSPHDDVWAAATVGWELFFGDNAKLEAGAAVAPWVRGAPSPAVVSVLLEALASDPALRLNQAAQVADKLEAAARVAEGSLGEPVMTSSDFAAAQSMVPRIRLELEELLSPPHSIIVPKEVTENVRHVLQWLNDDGTQALDLVRELGNFGPKVVPACLAEAHRVPPDSVGLKEVANAILPTAVSAPTLANEAIGWYCTQSSVSVRKMARLLAHQLRVCPPAMLDALEYETDLLLPHERTDLAVLGLLFSTEERSAATICSHLAREYFISQSAYDRLRREVAARFAEAHFDKRPERILHYVTRQRWSTLPEFKQLPEGEKAVVSRGVLQLFGDAFASLGSEALNVLKHSRSSFDESNIRWFRAFAATLAKQHEPTRRWILDLARNGPSDADIRAVAGQLDTATTSDTTPDLEKAFSAFMQTGETAALNQLRFTSNPVLFTLIEEALRTQDAPRAARVATLLHGFQNRQRARVVRTLLKYWSHLLAANSEASIRAASDHAISDRTLQDQVVQNLSALLNGPLDSKVRRGLTKLLEG